MNAAGSSLTPGQWAGPSKNASFGVTSVCDPNAAPVANPCTTILSGSRASAPARPRRYWTAAFTSVSGFGYTGEGVVCFVTRQSIANVGDPCSAEKAAQPRICFRVPSPCTSTTITSAWLRGTTRSAWRLGAPGGEYTTVLRVTPPGFVVLVLGFVVLVLGLVPVVTGAAVTVGGLVLAGPAVTVDGIVLAGGAVLTVPRGTVIAGGGAVGGPAGGWGGTGGGRGVGVGTGGGWGGGAGARGV